jgi:hypothetical protein
MPVKEYKKTKKNKQYLNVNKRFIYNQPNQAYKSMPYFTYGRNWPSHDYKSIPNNAYKIKIKSSLHKHKS